MGDDDGLDKQIRLVIVGYCTWKQHECVRRFCVHARPLWPFKAELGLVVAYGVLRTYSVSQPPDAIFYGRDGCDGPYRHGVVLNLTMLQTLRCIAERPLRDSADSSFITEYSR